MMVNYPRLSFMSILSSFARFDCFQRIFYTLFVITAGDAVLCGDPKSPPYIIHSAEYIFLFGPVISVNRIFRVLRIVL